MIVSREAMNETTNVINRSDAEHNSLMADKIGRLL